MGIDRRQLLIGIGLLTAILLLFFGFYQRQVPLEDLVPEKQDKADFKQIRMEKKMEADITNALKKLMEDEYFYVSVIANIDYSKHTEETVSIDPKIVTLNATKEYKNLTENPAIDVDFELPGMFDDALFPSDPSLSLGGGFTDSALPGFPDLSEGLPGLEDINPLEELIDSKPAQLPPDVGSVFLNQNSENEVYLNKVTKVVEKSHKIDHLLISILLDSNHIQEAEYEKEDLEKLLEHMANVDRQRGDKLSISFMPFKERIFTFHEMGLAIKKFLMSMVGIIVQVVLLLIIFLVRFLKASGRKKALAKLKQEEEARLAEEKALAEAKAQEEKFIQDRDSILEFTDQHPDFVANSLMDWIETVAGPAGGVELELDEEEEEETEEAAA